MIQASKLADNVACAVVCFTSGAAVAIVLFGLIGFMEHAVQLIVSFPGFTFGLAVGSLVQWSIGRWFGAGREHPWFVSECSGEGSCS